MSMDYIKIEFQIEGKESGVTYKMEYSDYAWIDYDSILDVETFLEKFESCYKKVKKFTTSITINLLKQENERRVTLDAYRVLTYEFASEIQSSHLDFRSSFDFQLDKNGVKNIPQIVREFGKKGNTEFVKLQKKMVSNV